ncbi:hypothetical protein MTO96_001796 [Rhipicephalus appendiculatus]
MKKLVLILVIVLLCEAMLAEAQARPPVRSRSPAPRRKKPAEKCGDKVCQPHEYCERQFLPVPTCGSKAPLS